MWSNNDSVHFKPLSTMVEHSTMFSDQLTLQRKTPLSCKKSIVVPCFLDLTGNVEDSTAWPIAQYFFLWLCWQPEATPWVFQGALILRVRQTICHILKHMTGYTATGQTKEGSCCCSLSWYLYGTTHFTHFCFQCVLLDMNIMMAVATSLWSLQWKEKMLRLLVRLMVQIWSPLVVLLRMPMFKDSMGNGHGKYETMSENIFSFLYLCFGCNYFSVERETGLGGLDVVIWSRKEPGSGLTAVKVSSSLILFLLM